MKILVSNDDGWQAPGIIALAAAMRDLGDVRVVAPDRNCSAASNSLTLKHPVRVTEHAGGVYEVHGTPTDCVFVALNGLLDWRPDIVVSGINTGPNLGDDVLYSGTVAAAMEGTFHGIPAIAFSLASYTAEFEVAAGVAAQIVARAIATPLEGNDLLNVNIPAVPHEQIAGTVVTRLGRRHRTQNVIAERDPRGERIYWIGPVSEPADGDEGTDFHAIEHNQVSVTPIDVDLTLDSSLSQVEKWLRGGPA